MAELTRGGFFAPPSNIGYARTPSKIGLKESKQSFCSRKNPLLINLEGKLQKPFDFFLRCQTCPIWLAYLLVEVPHVVLSCWGIGQFNCDNRSQQHVEAIHGSFGFIGPTRTSWNTSNRKWRNYRKIVVALNDSWNKTSTFFVHTCNHSTVGLGINDHLE